MTFIYSLNCPKTGRIRYIGKSDNPFKRFSFHLNQSGLGHTHKNNWIKALRAEGLVPTMEILDEVPNSDWGFWEQEYIRLFQALGFCLVNGTEGGDSPPNRSGEKQSLETKLKISRANSGKKRSDEFRQRMRLAFSGRKASEETRKKMSESHRGTTGFCHSEKTKQELSLLAKSRSRERSATGRFI